MGRDDWVEWHEHPRRSRRKEVKTRILLLLNAGLVACAGSAPAPSTPGASVKTASGFPTQSALADLASIPLPPATQQSGQVAVDEWTLSEGPYPEQYALYKASAVEPWEHALENAVSGKEDVLATANMQCVAREMGLFFLDHQAHPPPALTNTFLGRCKSQAVNAIGSAQWFHGLGEDVRPEVLFERVKAQLRETFVEHGRPHHSIAVWFGRKADKAVFYVAFGQRRSFIESIRAEEGATAFIVRGRLMVSSERTGALVNRGQYDVARCEPLGAQRLPDFEFRCELDPNDAEAWFELSSVAPGRMLGETVLRALLSKAEAFDRRYVAKRYGQAGPLARGQDPAAQLIAAINGVRADAGRSPMSLEATQSKVADRVAPHFFASATGRADPMIMETVVAGLRAGWDVGGGSIRSSSFVSILSRADVSMVVGEAVQIPMGRQVLLDPEAAGLALGTFWPGDERSLGLLATSYAFFGEEAPHELVASALERLQKSRRAAGLADPSVRRLPIEALEAEAVGRLEAGEGPREVSEWLLRRTTQSLKRATRSWTLEAQDLSELSFPKELLSAAEPEVGLVVVPYRPPSEPWGRYSVILILAGAGEHL